MSLASAQSAAHAATACPLLRDTTLQKVRLAEDDWTLPTCKRLPRLTPQASVGGTETLL